MKGKQIPTITKESTFGERLRYLMGNMTSRELVKRMFEEGLFEHPDYMADHEKRGLYKEVVKDVDKFINNTRKTPDNHLKKESASEVEGKWLSKYVQFFGCSADFLFGLIDHPTHEQQLICELTGLTERAADDLIKRQRMAKGEGEHSKAWQAITNHHYQDIISELTSCDILIGNIWEYISLSSKIDTVTIVEDGTPDDEGKYKLKEYDGKQIDGVMINGQEITAEFIEEVKGREILEGIRRLKNRKGANQNGKH